jgi:hypothetical protein
MLSALMLLLIALAPLQTHVCSTRDAQRRSCVIFDIATARLSSKATPQPREAPAPEADIAAASVRMRGAR